MKNIVFDFESLDKWNQMIKLTKEEWLAIKQDLSRAFSEHGYELEFISNDKMMSANCELKECIEIMRSVLKKRGRGLVPFTFEFDMDV